MNYRQIDPKEMGSGLEIKYSDKLDVLNLNKIALIDADYFKYEITYRMFLTKEEIGEEEFYERQQELLEEYTMQKAFSFQDKLKDPFIFCFSGPSYNTFRSKICLSKLYKGTRKGKKDYYEYDGKNEDMFTIVSLIDKKFNTLLFADLEADDLLSMLHCDNSYIISKDKDLKQIAGIHYDFENNSTYEISEKEALDNLFRQLVIGDSSDSIPGIFRYGPKKFDNNFKGLKTNREYLDQALDDFIEKDGFINGIDAFCEMWMLVKMRPNRGDYLREKYETAFNLKNHLLEHLKLKQNIK